MRISLRCLTYLLLLVALTLTFVSACSISIEQRVVTTKQSVEDCRVVQHTMGKTCIPRNPQRVVTLWTGTLANSVALGIKPVASVYIIGQPLQEYLRGKVDGVEPVGSLAEPNLEKILLLKPDLILSNTRLQNIYKQLSYIAPTLVLSLPSPPFPWKQNLEDLAKVLDKEEANQQLIDQYWGRIEKLKLALGDRLSQIRVSVATVSENDTIYAYGEKHPVGSVLNDIGLQRPLAQRGDFYYINDISEERLSDIDGDVIFFLYWAGKDAKKVLEKLQQKLLWQQLKAVQQNHVYFVDAAHWHGQDILAMNAIIDDLFKYLVNTP
ncbi:MAG: iron-siderophore ABC transporter substrate-binding protein [Cyanomargarita calcarea GSE-NOS-MK-12-04C]|jgi:iron complex transport system substrate-binding protein|uniref:Iron-siderophore ABC transporter substrate-binding protein n=1 Tax=Cyanomargarita calcarea GSE-NOS-MK-12-04C TaxID=2839659 RepID=A0A951QUE6_9CYAN|nr:iron-siderophore ABC transporter substrate-binding protein [Cyanomargarita calcarea GSE-NOS-MK-12-04C]